MRNLLYNYYTALCGKISDDEISFGPGINTNDDFSHNSSYFPKIDAKWSKYNLYWSIWSSAIIINYIHNVLDTKFPININNDGGLWLFPLNKPFKFSNTSCLSKWTSDNIIIEVPFASFSIECNLFVSLFK